MINLIKKRQLLFGIGTYISSVSVNSILFLAIAGWLLSGYIASINIIAITVISIIFGLVFGFVLGLQLYRQQINRLITYSFMASAIISLGTILLLHSLFPSISPFLYLCIIISSLVINASFTKLLIKWIKRTEIKDKKQAEILSQIKTSSLSPTVLKFNKNEFADVLIPRISKVDKDQLQPLTTNQSSLMHHESKNNFSIYNMPVTFKITGNLDKKIFLSCLRDLLDRHEGLRTAIDAYHNRQMVYSINAVDLEQHFQDLICDSEENAYKILMESSRKKFELDGKQPLFKVLMIKIANDITIWQMVLSHGLFDGASQAIFLQELGQQYRAKS